MRRIIRICSLCLVAVFPMVLSPAYGEEAEPAGAGATTEARSMAPIPELLSKARYLTRKKANLKAQYYGFLRSASWCVPCQMFVPKLLKDYRKMKGAKMELVLLGQEDEDVVKKYMEEHDYDIPGVMPAELGSIPGLNYEGLGFPSLCIVDADGNFIAAKGGIYMLQWKDVLKEHKKQLLKEKREAKKKKAREERDR